MLDQGYINRICNAAHWYAKELVDQVQRFVVGLVLAASALVLSASVGSAPGVLAAAASLFAAWVSYGSGRCARWAETVCPWLCAASYAVYFVEVV